MKKKYIAPRIEVVEMNSAVVLLGASDIPPEEQNTDLRVSDEGFYGEAKGNHFGLVSWDECFDFADDGLEY